eukprot:1325233-Amorphochlora_amoeboformis.AAC.1
MDTQLDAYAISPQVLTHTGDRQIDATIAAHSGREARERENDASMREKQTESEREKQNERERERQREAERAEV